MAEKRNVEALEHRFRALALKLAGLGPILQGTLTRRIITREPGEKGGRPVTYGPYYQWTFKNAGRTVTVNLSTVQAKLAQRAILNNRKLERTLAELRRLSRQLCEASSQGVKRRTRKTTESRTLS